MLGKRDCVTGTALEQGCDLDKAFVVHRQAPTVQNSAQSSEAQQSQFIDENIDIPVSAQRRTPSESNALRRPSRFHSWRIQKIMEIPQLQYTVKVVDVNAESSEDSAGAAGPIHREAG